MISGKLDTKYPPFMRLEYPCVYNVSTSKNSLKYLFAINSAILCYLKSIPMKDGVIGQLLQGHSLGCRKPSFPISNIDGLVKTPS